ncbi:phosphonate C-P lyase system protein PhnH [Epidermidibacterium keratini]|uniref:Phosphonate C-P lyase system protein PhnH n=1 Tax=Epidermidibacterium keratini TaxID=1891644 RepID=A0A7M3T4Z8_9ACTN|nr:phosphonate C-P lyase system protein PhnH [Epidermidibacterium keratini]QHB98844.1 phosphonate C-P lyase system protein PhnH [Epidermidibacterium keratini]
MRALTASEAQQTFRACLDAFAHPGRPIPIDRSPLPATVPAAYLPLLALTDLMSPIAALDDNALISELSIVTGAPIGALAEARWVASTSTPDSAALRRLNPGTALYPERGAVLCQQVDGFEPTDRVLELDGPGIAGTARISLDLLDDAVLEARAALVDYPCGIDLLLVSDEAILGIPRTTHISVRAPLEATA